MPDLATLKFGADTSELPGAVTKLRQVAETARVVKEEAQAMEAATGRASGSLGGVGRDAKGASDALSGLGRSTSGASQALGGMKGVYDMLSPSARKAVDALIRQKHAADEAAQASIRATSALGGMLPLLGKLAAFAGISFGVRAVQQMADSWSDMSSRVGLAIKNMDGAPAVMARLDSIAQRTYSSMQQTAESFAANSTSLRELGLNTAQQLDYTEALNNAYVVSGAKAERAASVSNALSKAMASGRLSGDNLNTVIESGGRVAELLAEKLGTTTAGLRQMGADGKITSAVIYDSLVGSLQTLRDEADSAPATISDAFTQIGNSVLRMVGMWDQMTGASAAVATALLFVAKVIRGVTDYVVSIGQLVGAATSALYGFASGFLSLGGVSESFIGQLLTASNVVDVLAAAVTALGLVFTARFAMGITSAVLPAMASLVSALAGTAMAALRSFTLGLSMTATTTGVLGAATQVLTGVLRGLRTVLMSLGIPALVIGLTMAVQWFTKLSNAVGGMGSALSILGDIARSVLSAIGNYAWGLLEDFAALWNNMESGALDAFASATEGAEWAFNGIIGAGYAMTAGVIAAWEALPEAMKNIAARAANALIDGMQGAISAVINMVNAIPLLDGKFSAPDLSGWKQAEGEAVDIMERVRSAVSAAFDVEYVGSRTSERLRNMSREAADSARLSEISSRTAKQMAADNLESASVVASSLMEIVKSSEDAGAATAEVKTQFEELGQAGAKGGGAAAKGAKAAGAASKDLLKELHKELDARQKLIGLSGEEDRKAKALQQVYSKLGESVSSYSQEAIDGAASRILAIEDEEERWNSFKQRAESVAGAIGDAIGDFTMRGFRDFKSMASSILGSFKDMLKQMIAMAVKNRIMVALGVGGAGGVAGAAQAGGGVLSSLGSLGGLGTGLGGVWSGVTGGFSSGGIMGALSGGLSASIGGISSGLAAGGLAGITSALGAALPIIGAVGAVFAVGKKLFGRSLKDTGIEASFSMAEDIMGHTYKFYKGGWLRSNKTVRTGLDSEVTNPVGQAMRAVGQSVTDMASTLSRSAKSIANLKHSISFSTEGMSEDDIQKRFTEEIEKYGEKAALAALPGLKKYLNMGETALQGLTRLSGALSGVNSALNMLGHTAYRATLAGANMASKLADQFGGVANMQQATSAYFERFYTAEEQRAYLLRSTTSALREVNLSLPKTREGYRKLVDAQNLNTEKGRAAYATLVSLAGAIDSLIPVAQATASVLNEVNAMRRMLGHGQYANSALGQKRAADLAAQFGGLDAMQSAVSSYFDKFYTEEQKRAHTMRTTTEALKAVNLTMPKTREEYMRMVSAQNLTTESGRAAYAALIGLAGSMDSLLPPVQEMIRAVGKVKLDYRESLPGLIEGMLRSIDRQTDYAREMANRARKLASAWRDAAQDMRDFVNERMLGEDTFLSQAEKSARAWNQYAATVAAARKGDVEAAKQVAGLADTYLGTAKEASKDRVSYMIEQAKVLASMDELARQAELAADKEDLQGLLYERMVDVLAEQREFLKEFDVTNGNLAELNRGVTSFQQAVNSIEATIKSVPQMTQDALTRALGEEVKLTELVNPIKELNASTKAMADAFRDFRAALSRAQGNNILVPKFAAGGTHRGGIRLVGETGPELEETGPSRIHNASTTAGLLGAPAAELRALREEVRRLREENTAGQVQVAKQTRRTADTLRRWDLDGQPEERAEA